MITLFDILTIWLQFRFNIRGARSNIKMKFLYHLSWQLQTIGLHKNEKKIQRPQIVTVIFPFDYLKGHVYYLLRIAMLFLKHFYCKQGFFQIVRSFNY